MKMAIKIILSVLVILVFMLGVVLIKPFYADNSRIVKSILLTNNLYAVFVEDDVTSLYLIDKNDFSYFKKNKKRFQKNIVLSTYKIYASNIKVVDKKRYISIQIQVSDFFVGDILSFKSFYIGKDHKKIKILLEIYGEAE